MLDRINLYAHGLVAVPVMVVCRDRGLFNLLAQEGPQTLTALAARMQANDGHLAAALRLLHALGWVGRQGGLWVAGPRVALAGALPGNLFDLLRFDPGPWLDGQGPGLECWLDSSAAGWGVGDDLIADLLDGPLVLPILLALEAKGVLDPAKHGQPVNLSVLPELARTQAHALILANGWASGPVDALVFGAEGRFLAERVFVAASTASYRPMLARMDDLLFGDAEAVFRRDGGGHETHVDRRLNVEGSGFQHEKFFADVDDVVVDIFNSLPVDAQPRFVADMGCGDGTLLARIHQTVAKRSARGLVLDDHPLGMIGLDFNARSCEATARTLSAAAIPHVVAHGDIGDPMEALAELARHGVEDPEQVLHVRSFLDHDRPFKPPVRLDDAARRENHRLGGVNISRDGSLVPASHAVQSLVEHLERWAQAVGRHGLVALEVHALPPEVVGRHVEQCENLHFDAYHAFSSQYLVEADVFLLSMAEAGLFPKPGFSRRYPRALPFTRISVNWYEKRAYRLRHPHAADLPALLEIEAACWPAPLRATEDQLRHRVESHPEWHLVLEYDGRVAAVLYSQRIRDAAALNAVTHDALPGLADADGRVVQLLGMNVLPQFQDKGLGDQLLEFMLLWTGAKAELEQVVGLTRLRDWHKHAPMPVEEYLRLTDGEGRCLDPIPRFHQSHGAALRGVVKDYRPADHEGGGAGILIAYDLNNRSGAAAGGGPGGIDGDPAAVVEASIRSLLGPQRVARYGADLALREMGFDSLDLLELKFLLGRALSTTLDTSFFFQHTTPRAIADFFLGKHAARGAMANPLRAAVTAKSARRAADPGEAIAVIGMGCRFPGGADTPEAYWRLLHDGVDAVGELDRRFPADALTGRFAALLDDVAGFDAGFFRISPREAAVMDPQQRLLLEVSWEALEHAGMAPRSLAGSDTGVFVGIFAHDYELMQVRANRPEDYGMHFGTGTACAVAAGRLAYFYDFHGAALSVDTACSSSLAAVHLAVRALRAGDCGLALAGGAHLILSPELCTTFNQAHMLAADGRCKTMDAAADGYVRGEGVGVVVLKRLSDALADNDRIIGVIQGSALNQDGASNGLTAPSRAAQVKVVQAALADAGRTAAEIGYVELHGTGTSLGDPVEASALAEVFAGRDDKVRMGSVKTNIGHLEAAAGIAGLMKVLLALQHEEIPRSLHFHQPSPHVDWTHAPLAVTAQNQPWPRGPMRRVAGVSAFGFSGTNAHVVVEEAPLPMDAAARVATRPVHALVLSARCDTGLATGARNLAQALEGADLAPVCRTAAMGRNHFEYRAAVVAATAHEAAAGLSALSQSGDAAAAAPAWRGHTGGRAPRIAFLFTGQGSQFPGMAADLYQTEPVFRDVMDRCSQVLAAHRPVGLADVLYGAQGHLLDRTEYTQPALFAVETALAALWRSWGIEPAAVMGHSVGEYAAACAAGVFPVEDGMALIAERGRLMQALPAGGAMVVVLAEPERVAQAVVRHGNGRVSVAAWNGPRNVVVSGESQAVAAVVAALGDVQAIPLAVSHAFHSALMDPMLDEFGAFAARKSFDRPRLEIVSNLTGGAADLTDPAYWVRHVREPVAFSAGMASLAARGMDVFLEIGPRPVLCGMARACGVKGLFLPSLTPEAADWRCLMEAVAQLYVRGADIRWAAVHAGADTRRIALPTYPFQRERHWLEARPDHPAAASDLPGRKLDLAGRDRVFEARLSAAAPSWVADHQVAGQPVLPMAALLLGLSRCGEGAVMNLTLLRPLVLGETVAQVQTVLGPDGNAEIFARSDEAGEWLQLAEATLSNGPAPAPYNEAPHGAIVDLAGFWRGWAARGISYGPAFRLLARLRRDGDTAWGRLEAEKITPAVLDSCLQVALAVLPEDGVTRLPMAVERFRLLRAAPVGDVHGTARKRTGDGREVTVDLTLHDDVGPLGEVTGLRFRPAESVAAQAPGDGSLYQVRWDAAGGDAVALDSLAAAIALPEDDQGAALAALEHSAAQFIAEALTGLGLPLEVGARFTSAEVLTRCNILPNYQRLLARLLDILAEDGLLRRDGPHWVVAMASTPGAADGLRQVEARFPFLTAELPLFGRCAAALAQVLTGEISPLPLIYPESDLGAAARFYESSAAMAGMNRALAEAVAAVTAARGAGARILEIGAGTGASTAAILPLLPVDTHYVFTDLSSSFTRRAAQRFAQYPNLSTRLLDVEREPAQQGFAGETFDVVIAANVLHATADLAATLRHARDMLAPGGVLVLLEGTERRRWIDLVFGLTEGWWRFADMGLRPDYALLSSDQWPQVLAQAGFADSIAVEPPLGGRLFAQAVIVARNHSAPMDKGRWLALGAESPLRAALAAQMTVAENLEQAGDLSAFQGVLYLADRVSSPSESIDACAGLLPIIRALANRQPTIRLVVATSGAVAAGGHVVAPCAAALWGMGRVVAQEHSELNPLWLDLDAAFPPAEAARRLSAELARPRDGETEIALRASGRLAPRLAGWNETPGLAVPPGPVCLDTAERGGLDALILRPDQPRDPGPGEIRVRVAAAGLNFLDVLDVLGSLPFHRDQGLGMEASGVVEAVGEGVSFNPGDAVVVLSPGCLRSHVVVDARLAVLKPAKLSHAEAAALPVNFVTAQLALRHVAQVERGETVLVHAATGGTGLACVQLARLAGARVLGTARADKWPVAARFGVERCFGSRNLDFVGQTGPVDVVVNSLAGPFIQASMDVLGQGGRFIELGKTGILSAAEAARLRPDMAYRPVDVFALCRDDPARMGALLAEIMDLAATGQISAPPRTLYPVERADAAFRLMQQAGHVGKIVLAFDAAETNPVRADATYVISGGLKGLGLSVAEDLAAQGARHLVLFGRSGADEQARARLDDLRAAGIQVRDFAADAADGTALAEIFATIAAEMPPIRGLIHAAGVLSDATLLDQNAEKFAAVMAPKVQGGWLLHTLTLGMDLDFFVLFGSVAGLLGSTGQANHAAANAFLDGLAHYRIGLGLPALSVDWAGWTEIGAAAGHDVRHWLAAKGIGAVTPRQGLDILRRLMRGRAVQMGVLPMDWDRFIGSAARPPFLSLVARKPPKAEAREDGDTVMARLAAAEDSAARRPLLVLAVQEMVAKVLDMDSAAKIPLNRGFFDLGLDSLTSLELRNLLQKTLGRPLSSSVALDHPTVEALAAHLAGLWEVGESHVTPETALPVSALSAAALEELSEEEAQALLLERLAVLG